MLARNANDDTKPTKEDFLSFSEPTEAYKICGEREPLSVCRVDVGSLLKLNFKFYTHTIYLCSFKT